MADLDDRELRQELLKFDVTVSKITDKNREILIKKLNHLVARQRASEAPPSPGRSPGRQSPGRAKKSPPRRSVAPRSHHSSGSDEDDLATTVTKNVTRHQKNLRRRTVDSSGIVNGERNDAVTSVRTRGTASASNEPLSTGKGKRQSFGANADSPFFAGSLRNPVLSKSSTQNGPSLFEGDVNDSVDNGEEFSGSDDDFSMVEVASAGVNTTQSLHNMSDTLTPPAGNLQSRPRKPLLSSGMCSVSRRSA